MGVSLHLTEDRVWEEWMIFKFSLIVRVGDPFIQGVKEFVMFVYETVD